MPAELPATRDDDLRVLVVPITRRDGEVTRLLLAEAGVACVICDRLADLAAELRHGAGAVMVTEAVLARPELADVIAVLDEQPTWSDIPVLLMVREQHDVRASQPVLEQLGNTTLMDRPVSRRSVMSTVLSALRDRRHQYRIRDQIERQQAVEQQLHEADRRKDEFLATLAHELRNPLAPIRSGLQMLTALPGQTGQARQLCAMMERQMSLMVRLIDELLDVSRIATGKITLRPETVDLRGVITMALEASDPTVAAGAHRLDVDVPDAPVWVQADPSRLAQVISNVVNNAAKYTPDGGRIELALRLESGPEGEAAVVAVKDNGVGLPEGSLDEVFQMFSQVERSIERSRGGLGIGLSLVRRLMALHGGTVTAESEGPGLGSTFTLRLPVAQPPVAAAAAAAAPAPAPGGAPAARQRRVLIIDDNVDAADTLAALAMAHGHDAHTAYTGAQGVHMAAELRPDMVLSDIGLPDMTGYEVASRLRALDALDDTTLVAVTGWGSDDDRRRAMESGFDRHLTKPIGFEDFLALFA